MKTLLRFFCQHRATITKTAGAQLYAECVRCGYESPGIETGGFKYSTLRPVVFHFHAFNRFAKGGLISKEDMDRVLRGARRSLFALALIAFASAGCAAKRPPRRLVMGPHDIAKILYNPKKCTELANGNYLCRDVVFVPKAVRVE